MDEIRLSLVQVRVPPYPIGFRCVPSTSRLLFHLVTGQRILIATPTDDVGLTPAVTPPDDTFPDAVYTLDGPILAAVRSVSFRVDPLLPYAGRICAQPAVLRAAVAAAR